MYRTNITLVLLICYLSGFSEANLIKEIPSSIQSTMQKITGSSKNDQENESNSNEFDEYGNISSVCFGELGCFNRGDFFDIYNRPISLLPHSPETIDATLTLFTSDNRKGHIFSYNISREDILNTTFDPQKNTKFIVHGYIEQFNLTLWMSDTKDRILNSYPQQYNVFCVDWSGGSQTLIYDQAVSNTRVVGSILAYFIEKLLEFTGTSLKQIHIIGHSLGGQIAGYTGKRFNGTEKIGRITALDPAGPSFHMDNPDARLNRNDASYVESLHTNGGTSVLNGFGLLDIVSDYDFFVNGGELQPGCSIVLDINDPKMKNIPHVSYCSHLRSTIIYSDSEDCQFVGYRCSDYKSFQDGLCSDCGPNNENCAIFNLFKHEATMDEHFLDQVKKAKQVQQDKYFFQTNTESPWCLFHYLVKVFSNTCDLQGSLKLDFAFDNHIEIDLSTLKKSNGSYNSLLTLEKIPKNIKEIEVKYIYGINILDPINVFKDPKINVDKIEMVYMSNIDSETRKKHSFDLCPEDNQDIKANEFKKFVKCNKADDGV